MLQQPQCMTDAGCIYVSGLRVLHSTVALLVLHISVALLVGAPVGAMHDLGVVLHHQFKSHVGFTHASGLLHW